MKLQRTTQCVVGILLSLASNICLGQAIILGARSVSMAGVSVIAEDVWSSVNNPAAMASLDQTLAGISLEQKYAMKELGHYGLAAAIPFKSNCFGFYGVFSGHLHFIDQKIGLSYGKAFGDHFRAGIGLLYTYQKAADHSSLHMASYHFGAIIDLSTKTRLGFSAFNPFQVFYKSQNYATLASVLNIALSYMYSPSLWFHTELEKDMSHKPVLKIATEYRLKDVFTLRGGFRIFPASWAFGAALHHKKTLIEIAADYHYYLGFSPVISIQYIFN